MSVIEYNKDKVKMINKIIIMAIYLLIHNLSRNEDEYELAIKSK